MAMYTSWSCKPGVTCYLYPTNWRHVFSVGLLTKLCIRMEYSLERNSRETIYKTLCLVSAHLMDVFPTYNLNTEAIEKKNPLIELVHHFHYKAWKREPAILDFTSQHLIDSQLFSHFSSQNETKTKRSLNEKTVLDWLK